MRSLAFVAFAACFSPDLGNAPFRCGADNSCPSGYRCDGVTCKKGGSTHADANVSPDGAVACEDASCPSGELCFPVVGCAAICGGSGEGRSEGCEFYPTAAGNGQHPSGFAVAIVNGGSNLSRVRIDGGGLDSPHFVNVPGGAARVE